MGEEEVVVVMVVMVVVEMDAYFSSILSATGSGQHEISILSVSIFSGCFTRSNNTSLTRNLLNTMVLDSDSI